MTEQFEFSISVRVITFQSVEAVYIYNILSVNDYTAIVCQSECLLTKKMNDYPSLVPQTATSNIEVQCRRNETSPDTSENL